MAPVAHKEHQPTKVALLVVNYNSGRWLRDCLASVMQQRRAPDQILVVDNASSDASLEIAADWLDTVTLIRLPTNVGFASANNIGARAATSCDAIALLNPDAIADPGWLQALLDAATRYPQAGAYASRMLLASQPERLDGAGDSYHTSGRAWRHGHLMRADEWPAGDGEIFAPCAAAALYQRAAFESVGGFDERYFCYFEDVDLGFRLRLEGYRPMYVHDAIVTHVSSGISGYRSDFAVYHGERNAVWTFLKNMPGPLLPWYLLQHLALNVAALLYYPWRGQGRVVWRAKWDAVRGLRATFRDRNAVQSRRTVGAWAVRRVMKRGIRTVWKRHRLR